MFDTLRTAAPDSSRNGDENLISAIQFAEKLAVSIRTIWRLDTTGKLPKPIRLGGSVRWSRNEINRWITARCPDRLQWEAMESQSAGRKDGGR